MSKDMQQYTVRVSPNSDETQVREEYGELRVRLTEPAEKGKANQELIHVLADYFTVDKNHVSIIRGKTSRKKTVVIH